MTDVQLTRARCLHRVALAVQSAEASADQADALARGPGSGRHARVQDALAARRHALAALQAWRDALDAVRAGDTVALVGAVEAAENAARDARRLAGIATEKENDHA